MHAAKRNMCCHRFCFCCVLSLILRMQSVCGRVNQLTCSMFIMLLVPRAPCAMHDVYRLCGRSLIYLLTACNACPHPPPPTQSIHQTFSTSFKCVIKFQNNKTQTNTKTLLKRRGNNIFMHNLLEIKSLPLHVVTIVKNLCPQKLGANFQGELNPAMCLGAKRRSERETTS